MSEFSRLSSVPDELRSLGTLRRLFEPSSASFGMCVVRGVFPMLVGAGIFMGAPRWFPEGGWKYYAVCAIGAGVFLNGLRVVVQALVRRGQKVASFDQGFALWRNRSLSIFRWEQIDEIEVNPAFFGFTVHCRTEGGRKQKVHFDSSTDPTDQLRGLWSDLEEQCWRFRLPAVEAAISRGEEVEFVSKTWGKETGTKIGVSSYGVAATPRYQATRFLDWMEIEGIAVDKEGLTIRENGAVEPWLSEHIMAVPGCTAIVEVGRNAQRRFLETADEVSRERGGEIETELKAGQQVTFGSIALTSAGITADEVSLPWSKVCRARLEGETLEVIGVEDDLLLDVEELDFRERVLLRVMIGQLRKTI
jgi:hypothetical protein